MDKVSTSDISIDSLSLELVQELYTSVMEDIQRLRLQWADLSALEDPRYDDQILAIFRRLDKLEYDFLPQIEQRLFKPQRTLEKAA